MASEYQLIPGKHKVLARAYLYMSLAQTRIVAIKPSEITFIAEAGHSYAFRADANNVKYLKNKKVSAKFSYWIVDKKSGKVVGGKKPN